MQNSLSVQPGTVGQIFGRDLCAKEEKRQNCFEFTPNQSGEGSK